MSLRLASLSSILSPALNHRVSSRDYKNSKSSSKLPSQSSHSASVIWGREKVEVFPPSQSYLHQFLPPPWWHEYSSWVHGRDSAGCILPLSHSNFFLHRCQGELTSQMTAKQLEGIFRQPSRQQIAITARNPFKLFQKNILFDKKWKTFTLLHIITYI